MDICGVQVKTCTSSLSGHQISKKTKSNLGTNFASICYPTRLHDAIMLRRLSCYSRDGDGYQRSHRSLSIVCKASGSGRNRRNKDDDPLSSPDGDEEMPPESNFLNRDWRDFRAHMINTENGEASPEKKPLGLKWAHPLTNPEKGCILIATEKLDGVHTFERTVVLLFSMGTNNPRDGPFGVVINRPLDKKIKEMRLSNSEVGLRFGGCDVHFGGPLDASILLLKGAENTKLPGFEEVIPGLYFGTRNSIDEATAMVRKGVLNPKDFTFFVGYSGWQVDQLRHEIEMRYWHVAACSLDLFAVSRKEGLWEDVLQLMGGQYLDLSRKPKQDG